ncbi:UNVERIFIED_CONTAM: hypothetical protein HDU68_003264, partial [Siphonaria sp. JEL0065]
MSIFPFAYKILCKVKVMCEATRLYIAATPEVKNLQAVFMSHSSPDALLDTVQLLVGQDKLQDGMMDGTLKKQDGSILKQDFNTFYHSYGHSGRKRTDQVYDCWRMHPEWPHLTIVGNRKAVEFGVDIPNMEDKPKNIHIYTRVNISTLRELQYKAGVHICPSQQEGYGHYINEARSMGALVVTTNHPPMNEFVVDGVSGILVDHNPPVAEAYQGMQDYFISPANVEKEHVCAGIEKVLNISIAKRKEMGRKGREMYDAETKLMVSNIKKLRKEAMAYMESESDDEEVGEKSAVAITKGRISWYDTDWNTIGSIVACSEKYPPVNNRLFTAVSVFSLSDPSSGLKVQGDKGSVMVTVVDVMMRSDASPQDLDLSTDAFIAVAGNLDFGIANNVQWSWVDCNSGGGGVTTTTTTKAVVHTTTTTTDVIVQTTTTTTD